MSRILKALIQSPLDLDRIESVTDESDLAEVYETERHLPLRAIPPPSPAERRSRRLHEGCWASFVLASVECVHHGVRLMPLAVLTDSPPETYCAATF